MVDEQRFDDHEDIGEYDEFDGFEDDDRFGEIDYIEEDYIDEWDDLPPAPVDIEPLSAEEIEEAKAAEERMSGKRGKHGKHAADRSSRADKKAAKAAKKARIEREKAAIPDYMKKSRRMRRTLIVIIILLIILLAVGGFFVMRMFQTVQTTATQQAQITSEEIDVNQTSDEAKETNTSTARRTTVPDLVGLFGLTQEQAVEQLAHGAQVSSSREVNEAGNPITTETRVALTTEPADSRTGTPTVYLGLDYQGHVIQAGYSASTSALGYGSFSFTDAVRNVGVIEQTLDEAGLSVPEHSVVLPDDKMEYSSYASDGITLTNESCDFAGAVEQNGAKYNWSAVLSYDYSMANATGNLADTMRTIYVYISTF